VVEQTEKKVGQKHLNGVTSKPNAISKTRCVTKTPGDWKEVTSRDRERMTRKRKEMKGTPESKFDGSQCVVLYPEEGKDSRERKGNGLTITPRTGFRLFS